MATHHVEGNHLAGYCIITEAGVIEYDLCYEPHQDVVRKKLHVDHCHKTGKVRALLCSNCNNLLGKARDRIDLLQKAIKYLEYHNKN